MTRRLLELWFLGAVAVIAAGCEPDPAPVQPSPPDEPPAPAARAEIPEYTIEDFLATTAYGGTREFLDEHL